MVFLIAATTFTLLKLSGKFPKLSSTFCHLELIAPVTDAP
jgi:hypothetical protein